MHSIITRPKGGDILSAKGYIQVRAYTSYAQIPLQDVTVSITDSDGQTIALRSTNRDGMLDVPVEITVPNFSVGQRPETDQIPFGVVNLYARLKDYEAIEIENLQIFPDRTTTQNLEMIPLSELPDSYNKLEIFPTPPQNL